MGPVDRFDRYLEHLGEGRGWRGLHHHAALSMAAYGFLMAKRLVADKVVSGKSSFIARQVPAFPEDYIPRGSASAKPFL